MIREWALKVLLVLVGLVLLGCLYPLATSLWQGPNGGVSAPDQMILGIYFPIGIFMLLAARDPSAHRSLILCFAWSTLGHDAVMWIQAVQGKSIRDDALPLSVIFVVCVALLALTSQRVGHQVTDFRSGVSA